ncbi:MAG: alpha/beta hydrolase [Flavobacteriales bacterium]|nr:alpha/beta hydrolase [Flavobacteriales bacterium]
MALKKIYCLSGLGVDHRAFQHLNLEGFEMVHIPWVKPLKGESLQSYSKRLFETVDLPQNYILIGVSFGGMVAQEFAKIQSPKQLFLISTIRNFHELPLKFKLAKVLNLHQLLPISILKSANFYTNYLFGVHQKKHKRLLKEILKDTDPYFLRWALQAILHWKNNQQVSGYRIHGDRDRILKAISPNLLIKEGGHFMIVTKAKEVEQGIKRTLTFS